MLIAIGAWTLPLLWRAAAVQPGPLQLSRPGRSGLHGYDPYSTAFSVSTTTCPPTSTRPGQNTPAPYGPLFILVPSGRADHRAEHVVGVVAMRMTMCVGLVLLCWALASGWPSASVAADRALWFGAANPLVLAYLVGGGTTTC